MPLRASSASIFASCVTSIAELLNSVSRLKSANEFLVNPSEDVIQAAAHRRHSPYDDNRKNRDY
jgi:hypothetical protein